jgi:Tfp pilus assembly protein PilO
MTVLMAFVILAVGYYGVYGFWTKLSDARATFQVSKEKNEKLLQANAAVTAFLNQYNSNLTEAEKANRTLPFGDPDVPILLDYYSKMVTDSGLTLVQLGIEGRNQSEVAKQADHNSIQSVDVKLQASGSYEAFKDYLLRVRRSLRLTDVVSVNVSADEGGTDSRLLKYDLRIKTYYQK